MHAAQTNSNIQFLRLLREQRSRHVCNARQPSCFASVRGGQCRTLMRILTTCLTSASVTLLRISAAGTRPTSTVFSPAMQSERAGNLRFSDRFEVKLPMIMRCTGAQISLGVKIRKRGSTACKPRDRYTRHKSVLIRESGEDDDEQHLGPVNRLLESCWTWSLLW